MLRVLIADDERWILTVIKSILSGMGEDAPLIVGEGEDGLHALTLCKALKPDLLITDIRMPGLNGLELIEQVSALSPQTKIIIISGYTDFEYARRALTLHAFDYLLKPIDEETLMCSVRRAERIIHARSGETGTAEDAGGPGAQEDSVERALRYIREHYSENLTLKNVARSVFLNPNYFSSAFKKRKGVNFSEYLTALRMEKARHLLDTGMKIYEVSRNVGYQDPKYFAKLFKKHCGCIPREYRRLNSQEADNVKDGVR